MPFAPFKTIAIATAMALVATPVFALTAPPAVFNAPLAFSQAGSVTVTLEESEGGFDHALELSSVLGAIGPLPLMLLTALSDPSPAVLGMPPALAGATAWVGNFGAGQEIGLRITNIGSGRFGDAGVVEGQVFTGSLSTLNAQPTSYYTLAQWLSPTQLRVQFEDLFPADPGSSPTGLGGYDAQFLLTLAPVPEPGTAALWLAGLAAMTWVARRRVG